MKQWIILAAAGALAACQTTAPTAQTGDSTAQLNMTNPASEFCVKQGGRLEIKDEANGQVGYCHINGEVIEEWAYFRSQQAKCDPEQAQTLVGQALPTEQQMKDLTKAEIVRQLGPNQPMTMDYRENRLTVVVDEASQKILKASCG